MNEEKNKKLIIFGAGNIASVAHYYFTYDSSYSVAAFTVEQKYIEQPFFNNLPLIAFEEITKKFPIAKILSSFMDFLRRNK